MMNEDGSNNIMVGYAAGKSSQGSLNVFIGTESGTNNDTGWGNVFIGELAGYNNDGGSGTAGARNVFLGFRAGYENLTGGDNVYIGSQAGGNTNGSSNVFIGFQVGYNESGSDKLYIANSSTSTPLIWGDFNLGQLKFNGDILSPLNIGAGTGAQEIVIDGNGNGNLLQTTYREEGSYKGSIGWDVDADRFFIYTGGNALFAKDGHVGINNQAPSGSYALYVNGSIHATGSITSSDARYKENIVPISSSLSKIMSIDGVYFTWNRDGYPEIDFGEGRQVGFIAQDIQKILPEVVSFDDKGFAGVDYPKITAVLVEAIKEQQKIIDDMSGALKDSNSELDAMKERLRSAEDKINLILSTLK